MSEPPGEGSQGKAVQEKGSMCKGLVVPGTCHAWGMVRIWWVGWRWKGLKRMESNKSAEAG